MRINNSVQKWSLKTLYLKNHEFEIISHRFSKLEFKNSKKFILIEKLAGIILHFFWE